MSKRSLQASSSGLVTARQHFANRGWTQEHLAHEVGIKTRQPIWRFFSGQPIERYTFFEVCTTLDLDWRDIAIDPPAEYSDFIIYSDASKTRGKPDRYELDLCVKKLRSQRYDKIKNQCGILQLLDVSRPVSIDRIYIDVNILEQIASQQSLEVSELNNLVPADIDRFGIGQIAESHIPSMQAVEKYGNLRVLGKPGSGKSTFLKHLAIQCNIGAIAINQVPIFIELRDFAENCQNNPEIDLLNYIHQEFLTSNKVDIEDTKMLLQSGRVLLLIDGMDEVWDQQQHAILTEIRRFIEKYHKNKFVATCRIASQKLGLKGFTDVEVAPFTQTQITTFATKWFIEFSKTNETDGMADSLQFMEKLELPENWRFRRLVTTPLFLHLACSIFHREQKFPLKQAEFYKQGMDLLLGKWDESRGIERDQIYQGFLLPQKLKLLSQIAGATFERGEYFFTESVIEQHITDYMQTLPNAATDREEIHETSAEVLRAIESQHGILAERARGIFSFSYLALQEYFTARKIVASHNLQRLGQSLSGLVSHITDPDWREIFLLTASMLRSADGLMQLMKQQIDALVTPDAYLQEYLTWASQKSNDNAQNNPSAPKPATNRAFYLALTQLPHLAPHFALACTLNQGIFLDGALDSLLQECMQPSPDFSYVHGCSDSLNSILGIVLDVGFHKSLQQLSDRLPNRNHTSASFENWCQLNYAQWLEDLQQAIAIHRHLSYEWKFNPTQQQTLQRYYAANQLLLDCLNSNCEVTTVIKEQIESNLLLPQTELEKREWA